VSQPQSVEIAVRDVPVTKEDLMQLQSIISGLIDAALSEERESPEPESAVLVDVSLQLRWKFPSGAAS
jgi:hypothetical protein